MSSREIKILALDLDGTLLDSQKNLTIRNRKALEEAARLGITIIPTTGRVYETIPLEIRNLPFVRYFITSNGALVYDRKEDAVIVREEIPLGTALELMCYLDTFDVIYDCYRDDHGWMTERFMQKAEEYIPDSFVLKFVRDHRTCVPELKSFLKKGEKDVQKVISFVKQEEDRKQIMEGVSVRFPELVMGSSSKFNIEFNIQTAHKGVALKNFAERFGYSLENCMAMGDGTNDFTMVKMAGLGVAMGNAFDEVKQGAKWVTESNDCDGVAVAIEKFLFTSD